MLCIMMCRSPPGSQYVECMKISLGSGLVGMLLMMRESELRVRCKEGDQVRVEFFGSVESVLSIYISIFKSVDIVVSIILRGIIVSFD